MSAVVFDVQSLLVGKVYTSRSRKISGIIQDAEKRDGVWYENADAYVVRVRPTYQGNGIFQDDFYATVAVKVGE